MTKAGKQKGFGVVEIILIVIVGVLVVAGGWWVWQNNWGTKTNDSLTSSVHGEEKAESSADMSKEELKENWLLYSSKEGQFSLKYPQSWKLPKNKEDCPKGAVLLGSGEEYVGICQSDKISQVTVLSLDGDQRAAQGTIATTNFSESNVTVQGVSGLRRTMTYADRDSLTPYGTKSVSYIFYVNNRTYKAIYEQPPGYPDDLSIFEKIVTETLKFSE